MRTADLQAALGRARDDLPAADAGTGRRGVARRVRRHRVERVGAMTLVVVLGAGLAWAVAAAGGDRSHEGELHTDPGTLPLLVPTYLPDGESVIAIVDLPPPGPPEVPGDVHQVAWADGGERPEGGERIVSLTAFLSTAEQQGQRPFASGRGERWRMAWIDGDRSYLLVTVGLDQREAEEVRDSVRWEEGTLSADVPGGLDEVHRLVRPMTAPTALTPGGADPGYIERMGRPGEPLIPGRQPNLAMVTATPASGVWVLATAERFSATEVRGHPAWVVASPPDDHSAVTWLHWWEEGAMVTVAATSEDEARRIAEGLREVSPEAWAELRARVPSSLGTWALDDPAPGPGPATTVAGGP